MLRKLSFFLYQFVFWLFFFLAVKVVFLLYHFRLSSQLPISDWWNILSHGLPMDISAAGYLMLIPSVLYILFGWTVHKTMIWISGCYTVIMLTVLCLLAVIDMNLYRYWGFHLDATPLAYISEPGDALASISAWEITGHIVLACILATAFIWFYFRTIRSLIGTLERTGWITPLVFSVLTAALILPIRGGTGIAPMNVGRVYFHKKQFANHAAINYVWNIGNSFVNLGSIENPYLSMSADSAVHEMNSLFVKTNGHTQFLSVSRPNIVLIILESFTAKIIQPLGGMPDVTPNFTRLTKEGILFSNLYASGDRSDKGLVSIFSGFPSQPQKTIIIYPSKTEKLPGLSKSMRSAGYNTAFYYGGNLDFASMRSYMTILGMDRIITMDDFPASDRNSKWGVHDHYVFDRLSVDLANAKPPFFYSYFTLSSHEPFEIPVKPFLSKNDPESMYLSSAHYTDSALGAFINKAKKTKWWKNTLFILIADHGTTHPGGTVYYAPEKFHIPMLWLGGAVNKKDTVITQYCSQTDLAATLLQQMKLSSADYTYSNDILNKTRNSFSWYVFNNGFGMITDSAKIIYDFNSKAPIHIEGRDSLLLQLKGKAFMQCVYDDFLKK